MLDRPTNWSGMFVPDHFNVLMHLFMGMCVAQNVVLACLCQIAQPIATSLLCCGTQIVWLMDLCEMIWDHLQINGIKQNTTVLNIKWGWTIVTKCYMMLGHVEELSDLGVGWGWLPYLGPPCWQLFFSPGTPVFQLPWSLVCLVLLRKNSEYHINFTSKL